MRVAALHAQELVVTVRAIEARVSALTPETPASVVEETAALVRATALQIAATVHEMIAASVGFASTAAAVPDGAPMDYPARP